MFIETQANKKSIASRKLVYGCGINDAEYLTSPTINGKQQFCPYYIVWINMLGRCYSHKYHEKKPTYKNANVIHDWLIFSTFKKWMESQDWKGKQLDKDLLINGNKTYSPDTCLFVTKYINTLLVTRLSYRALYPLGVTRVNNDFMARCCVYGKSIHIKTCPTPEDAHKAYCNFKSDHVMEVAKNQDEPLKSALIRISHEIRQGSYHK